MKSKHIEDAEQQYLTPKHFTRAYDQQRLQRREVCRREQGHALGWRVSSIRRLLADDAQPLRECVQPHLSLNRVNADVRTGKSTNVWQRVSFASIVDQKAKHLSSGKLPVVRVREECSQY